jgi:RNA polymerase sigma-70 factor (ECF subfamily)
MGFARRSYVARRALVNGAPGVVAFVEGEPFAVLGFTIARGKVVELNILTDPTRLRRLDLAALAP